VTSACEIPPAVSGSVALPHRRAARPRREAGPRPAGHGRASGRPVRGSRRRAPRAAAMLRDHASSAARAPPESAPCSPSPPAAARRRAGRGVELVAAAEEDSPAGRRSRRSGPAATESACARRPGPARAPAAPAPAIAHRRVEAVGPTTRAARAELAAHAQADRASTLHRRPFDRRLLEDADAGCGAGGGEQGAVEAQARWASARARPSRENGLCAVRPNPW